MIEDGIARELVSSGDTTDSDPTASLPFDFVSHRRDAEEQYRRVFRLYEDFAQTVGNLLHQSLAVAQISVHSVEARAKDIESFGRKAALPADSDPERPKYPDPLLDITDLAAARIITFFLRRVEEVDRMIVEQFEVIEKTNRSELLEQEERLGYQSVHYLVRLQPSRRVLPEYVRFAELVAEIQVRTILQHAWAEIEHDIQYKSVSALPALIRRRFLALAGMLEIGDREFQAIADDHAQLRQEARRSVREGRLELVEITPDSLKEYLDRRLGPDGRMSDVSYGYFARVLKRLGFTNLQQVQDCIARYNDDRISRALYGFRQGQLNRFEGVLLASMGEEFIKRHPFYVPGNDWWPRWGQRKLEQLREANIPIGSYTPKGGHTESQRPSEAGPLRQ